MPECRVCGRDVEKVTTDGRCFDCFLGEQATAKRR